MILIETLNTQAPKGHGIVYAFSYKGIIIYVGSTRYTIGHRAGTFGKKYVQKQSSSKFGEFILEHGWENLEVQILEMPKLEDLTKVENSYIEKYDLINNGCNLYHACCDDEDTDEYTMKVDGYKVNVYHADPLRGDVRVGLIHDKTMKLNLIDKNIFKGLYVAQQHGNKEKNNSLAYFDTEGRHLSVLKKLRETWFGEFAEEYNISLDPKLAEDNYDYRRETVLVNRVGRAYKKMRLTEVLIELAKGNKPLFTSKTSK